MFKQNERELNCINLSGQGQCMHGWWIYITLVTLGSGAMMEKWSLTLQTRSLKPPFQMFKCVSIPDFLSVQASRLIPQKLVTWHWNRGGRKRNTNAIETQIQMQLKHKYKSNWNTNTNTLKPRCREKEKERIWCMYNEENLDNVTRTWDITMTMWRHGDLL